MAHKKEIIRDIELTLERAATLFQSNSNNFSQGIAPAIYEPIVPLACSNTKQSNEKIEIKTKELPTKLQKPNIRNDPDENFINENSLPINRVDNRMENVLREVQMQLDTKAPEEILTLFSEDLEIPLSHKVSPRADVKQHSQGIIDNETQKIKKNKKNKKILEKQNILKFETNKGSKIKDSKPLGQLSKTHLSNKQENSVKRLMKIYGSSVNTESQSKPGVSKHHISSKKMAVLKKCSSKTSSIALSKKSKRKRSDQKISNLIECDLQKENLMSLEKSSRVSTRRRNKKSCSGKLIRIPKFKKKKVYEKKEGVTSEVSNFHQIIPKKFKYSSSKISNVSHLSEPHIPQGNNDPDHQQKKYKSLLNFNGHVNKTCELNKQSKHSNCDLQHTKTNTIKQSHNSSAKFIKMVNHKDVDTSNNYLLEKSEMPYTEICYNSTTEDLFSEVPQHYTLPTQSSRSKEVAKFLIGHYQNFPFVVGQSTNKSHNLWVNLQEALSLINKNKPHIVDGMQNIVYESGNERPLSQSSKLFNFHQQKSHLCPAVVKDNLYDIPEGNTEGEEVINSWEDHPQCIQANLDPQNVRPRCSCTSQQSMSYKKVLRQLFAGEPTIYDVSKTTLKINGNKDILVQEKYPDKYTTEIKKILTSFTKEFEDLNKEYEDMLLDPNIDKEKLNHIETLLKNKEQEIREILENLNEVKSNGFESNHLDERKGGFYNLESFKSTTSVRLAQTLRKVQTFKDLLKSRPRGPFYLKGHI